MPVLITRARITELVMLARTSGQASHAFAAPAGGAISLSWSSALSRALLTFTYDDGGTEYVWVETETAETQIWRALELRMSRLLPPERREANA